MKAVSRWFLSSLAVLATAGCLAPVPPDPNDPGVNNGAKNVDSLLKSLTWMSNQVNDRRLRGELTDEEGKAALKRFAQGLLKNASEEPPKPEEAWKYADLYRNAGRWRDARRTLKQAVEYAKQTKNEDRRVNDTLRLAQAMANLGEVKAAIKTARTAFDAGDRDAAPILPATLLEIVPAAAGKGHDALLAVLLEEAIKHHRRTIIDPESDAGKAFLATRWRHIADAWKRVIELYQSGGQKELARQAALRAEAMLLNHRRI